MSVAHRKGGGGDNAELRKELNEVKATEKDTVALLSLSFKAQIIHDRATKTNVITDEMILQSTDIVEYDDFKDNHKYDNVGEIFKFGDHYFEIVAKHTSNSKAFPVETTFAYYRHVELTAAGTIDDPIPYPEAAGVLVNVVKDKYYSYRGSVYLAKADMPHCSYPPDTAGLWQWEKVK